ncbi:MAG: hypothetical protein PHP48_09520, partial [Bacteroidales bacterium]|nr:hypothetical protein [Bacteroidales bacterium]
MKKYLLPILFSVIFFGFGNELKAQCPPEINISAIPGTNTVISGNNVSFCPGDSCLLTASPSSGVTYEWYHDGNIIAGETTNVYYPNANGEYHVIVSGCADPSISVNVNLFPLPNGMVKLSSSLVCSGTDVDVELEGIPDLNSYDYGWLSPFDGYPIDFTFEATGTTTVRAFLANEQGCSRIISNTVVVQQPIDPGDISADQQICSGTPPEMLTGPAATGGAGPGTYTYQWQSSTNGVTWSNISGATSLSYQPGELTETTLFRRIVFNDSPCPAVTQYTPVTITVDEIPTVTSPSSISICSYEAVDYVITSDVPGTTFAWTGANTSGTVTGISASGSGTSINDILTIPPGGMASGIATYTIIPTGPAPTFCEGEPFELVVTVLPLPIPSFIDGATPVCVGSSGNLYRTEPGMTNYDWTISNGGTINSGQGTYEISVTWTSNAGPKWVRVSYTGT